MTLILVTPPAAEPVPLADAKAFLKLQHDDDDALVATLVAAARLHVEASIRQVLVEQGWRLVLDGWPGRRLVEIPLSPVISVDEVRVRDAAGDAEAVDPALLEADLSGWPPRLSVGGTAAPGARFGGIEIDFTAGFGAPADVPAPLVQAVLQLAAHWYETREPVAFGGPVERVPHGLAALLAPYRRLSL